ncbi:hypothetical protein [Lysinibacillus sp. TE18511]
MSEVTVATKSELEEAKNNKYDVIIVRGELANKLHTAKKITKLSKAALAILGIAMGGAVVAAPLTGGLSFAAAAPIAAATGASIPAIIATSAVGLALIIAVFKDYEEVEFSKDRLRLKRSK